MEVVARGLTLEAPDEIPSGWTTLRFSNEAEITHFVVVERLPEGQSEASQQAEVAPIFQDGMNLLAAGDPDAALEAFGALPPWFGEIVFLGGPGLTGPNAVSGATIHLEPGTYLLECYVKTGGVFHSFNPDPAVHGMVHEFRVTAETTDVPEPTPTLEIAISSSEGIRVDGTPSAGDHTIAVRFTDQTVHENFVGHDVHLARLSADADPATVAAWMDWRTPTGLQTPAPADFLGGLNEMPAGSVGYFDVTLAPGRYVLVSEVPGSGDKGMLHEFTVQ
jgi:hypothetical protein